MGFCKMSVKRLQPHHYSGAEQLMQHPDIEQLIQRPVPIEQLIQHPGVEQLTQRPGCDIRQTRIKN
jgi:hypothetical protein